jgi:hypothetical protein
VLVGQAGCVQGESRLDRELLDAAALCGDLLEAGSVQAFLAEHRRRLFPDEMFADLFPSDRGRPSVPADVVATVMLLQVLEGLSDREAVRALRRDIAWKAACGLAINDKAFHPTVLTLWRNKLRASEAPERIFDAMREVVAATGVLAGKTRRALDSTVLDDAVARQDTVTMLQAQIRGVRKDIPQLTEQVWVREHNLEPGRPPCDWDDPDDINRLVTELVDDANELVWATEDLDLTDEQADAGRCWRSSPAKTSSPGSGPASGGSPAAPPPTASCLWWTPRRGTPTRPSTRIGTATRPMWRSSPTPASSPAATSRRATPQTPKPPKTYSTANPRAPKCSATRPMAPANCATTSSKTR